MSNRLAEILANKRLEIARLEMEPLRRSAECSPTPRDFIGSIRRKRGEPVRLVAELKRASPSRGLLAPHLNLTQVAQIYLENGAAAISVLTDEKYFLGRLETLHDLRFQEQISLPLLRKDFLIDAVQIYEARANGADAILLIAAALPDDGLLADLHELAISLGLAPLVEVHTSAEVDRVLKIRGLSLVGINNRNLSDFNVSLTTTERLRPFIPAGITVIAESGIFSAADVERLAKAQVDGVLVGEALVTAPDIAAKVAELSQARSGG
jgi:indole-3-glycerol phosphate synthase